MKNFFGISLVLCSLALSACNVQVVSPTPTTNTGGNTGGGTGSGGNTGGGGNNPDPGTGNGGGTGSGGGTSTDQPVTSAWLVELIKTERAKYPTPPFLGKREMGGQILNDALCGLHNSKWGLQRKIGGHACTVDGVPETVSCDRIVRIDSAGRQFTMDILADSENQAKPPDSINLNGGELISNPATNAIRFVDLSCK